jgi:hypothetical protein
MLEANASIDMYLKQQAASFMYTTSLRRNSLRWELRTVSSTKSTFFLWFRTTVSDQYDFTMEKLLLLLPKKFRFKKYPTKRTVS